MQFSRYRSELQAMIAKRNGYLLISVAALTLCALLTGSLLLSLGHEKTILVPPVIEKSFWVSNAQVSEEYLAEMTSYFAYLRLNSTPASADAQHSTLLQYTDPHFYNQLKGQLDQEAAHSKDIRLSTAFFPLQVTADPSRLQAEIRGDLHGRVGDTLLPIQRVTYAVRYRFVGGRLWVHAFAEVTP